MKRNSVNLGSWIEDPDRSERRLVNLEDHCGFCCLLSRRRSEKVCHECFRMGIGDGVCYLSQSAGKGVYIR